MLATLARSGQACLDARRRPRIVALVVALVSSSSSSSSNRRHRPSSSSLLVAASAVAASSPSSSPQASEPHCRRRRSRRRHRRCPRLSTLFPLSRRLRLTAGCCGMVRAQPLPRRPATLPRRARVSLTRRAGTNVARPLSPNVRRRVDDDNVLDERRHRRGSTIKSTEAIPAASNPASMVWCACGVSLHTSQVFGLLFMRPLPGLGVVPSSELRAGNVDGDADSCDLLFLVVVTLDGGGGGGGVGAAARTTRRTAGDGRSAHSIPKRRREGFDDAGDRDDNRRRLLSTGRRTTKRRASGADAPEYRRHQVWPTRTDHQASGTSFTMHRAGAAAGALCGYCDLAPTLRRLAAQRRARERRDGLAAAE